MTPPIELRTRSPLGECYRSPLGAFGPGAPEAPQQFMNGTVEISVITGFGVGQDGIGYRDLNQPVGVCGRRQTDTRDPFPYTDYSLIEIGIPTSEVNAGPGNANGWRSWLFVGDISGAVWIPSGDGDYAECDTGTRESWWSTAGVIGPDGFRPTVSSSRVLEGGRHQCSRSANPGSTHIGFSTGESVKVYY